MKFNIERRDEIVSRGVQYYTKRVRVYVRA